MEALLGTLPESWLTFLLVLGRCTGFMVAMPLLGSTQIPRMVRAMLTLLAAAALAGTVPTAAVVAADLGYMLMLGGELVLGLALGYLVTMSLAAIQLGGELMDYSIGLGFMQIVDPLSNENTSVLAQVQFILAVMLFLALNGHLMVLRALGESCRIIPPGAAALSPEAARYCALLGQTLFWVGLQIAAPLYVAMLTINALEGILGRTVPQINILVAGFPVRIMTGLLLVVLGMGVFFQLTRGVIFSQTDQLAHLLEAALEH